MSIVIQASINTKVASKDVGAVLTDFPAYGPRDGLVSPAQSLHHQFRCRSAGKLLLTGDQVAISHCKSFEH